ncbi:MAG: sigma-54 dependent transcriptional regulator [Proteobacteria bacterium]|nr:sigma-54 dependent transcriptional regulator [Pseudomonadota bacterium]MBU1742129.1 sigma-54 dependent transcriptional regulator [Pseudomonadota bacterium]
MAKVLIIDDNEMFCDVLSDTVLRMGHEVDSARTLVEGEAKASSGPYDVVFLDVRMPDGNGLEIIPRIRATPSQPEIIIVTGHGDPDSAELAINSGAWDYVQKSTSIQELELPLVRAVQYRERRRGGEPPVVLDRRGIVGSSPQLNDSLRHLARAAASDANVLITGQTGSGKELFARGIHRNSSRSEARLVVVDCAALPDELVESILFGHKRGAFTSADRDRQGLVEQAQGGTLFLDEVGELPLPVQKTFLRVLEEHRFRPVGGQAEVECHFRTVAATNRDLDQMVGEGAFRDELLFRLRALTIELPPLRDREGDLKELARYYVDRACERQEVATKGFSPDFLKGLSVYQWPGNVRELFRTLDSCLAAAGDEPTLYPHHLPRHIRVHLAQASLESKGGRQAHPPGPDQPWATIGATEAIPALSEFRDHVVAEAEKRYLGDLKALTGSDIKAACRISGLSRSRLYALRHKHK